jgi:protein-S-isoprenylcysteine O-methyltransferase Ste14
MLLIFAGVMTSFFTGFYLLLRWLHTYLPDLYAWADHPVLFNLSEFPITVPQFIFLIIGLFLFLWGRMLVLRSRRFLHHRSRNRRAFPDSPDNMHEFPLVTEGPYRKKRHPMYAGFILVKIAFGIALSSLYMLIWAGLFIVLRIVNGIIEERKPAEKGKEKWKQYRQKTKVMFFPSYIWAVLLLIYGTAWLGFIV